jgi:hypothetical protein
VASALTYHGATGDALGPEAVASRRTWNDDTQGSLSVAGDEMKLNVTGTTGNKMTLVLGIARPGGHGNKLALQLGAPRVESDAINLESRGRGSWASLQPRSQDDSTSARDAGSAGAEGDFEALVMTRAAQSEQAVLDCAAAGVPSRVQRISECRSYWRLPSP